MTERNADIARRYLNGESTDAIATHYGISDRQVRNILTKLNVPRRKGRNPIYEINTDFFKTWTNDMAYVLGFILTDGNIVGNVFSISQVNNEILTKINEVMASTYPIHKRKNGRSYLYNLTIYRRNMVDDLKAIGITENKSTTIEMPDIPAEYMADFIRGVIDGDGWVQDRGYVMNITTASEIFAEQLRDVFEGMGLNTRIAIQSNAYRVWVSGKNDVIKLAEWLYGNEPRLYLERKRERFYVNKKTLAS